MASAVTLAASRVSARSSPSDTIQRFALLFAIAVAAVFLHGYHPYIVDGSIYITGIEKNIHPELFARDSAFVATHAHLSIFSAVMGRLQIASGIPLSVLVLLCYLALVYGFLLLCYALGERMFAGKAGGWGAALLMAACMPIPVAATSLLLIDPYLTARSFSTDLSLLAILTCVRGQWRAAVLCCVLALMFHPLMGVYLAAFLGIYFLTLYRRWVLVYAACGAAFLVSAAITLADRRAPVSASYREAILSRSYYFPTTWHWFEIAGLLTPLLLLGLTWSKAGRRSDLGRLAGTCLIVGSVSSLCSFCFIRPAGPYLLAQLQLLRSFHTIYALGIVMLGGALATYCPGKARVAAGASLVLLAAGMFLMQRDQYRTLPDVEWPGMRVANAWEQGFRWIRASTPQDALFAMDPRLMDFEDEAAPGFRAITQRSILTDVKDEGVASLFPALAPVWAANRRNQQALEGLDDGQRRQRLEGLGVGWILLSPTTATGLACPYHNAAMQVCSLSGK